MARSRNSWRRRCALAAAAVPLLVCEAFSDPSPPELVNPCRDPSSPSSKMPWCDPKIPIDGRVKDLVSRLSLQEKIGHLGHKSPEVPSLGISSYNWWSEATHGVKDIRRDQTTPYTTSFAFPITTAMSFNRTMWKKTGAQIGREARAAMNVGNAYSTFWAPVINLARDPRWGRNIETPGEDPFLSGEYSVAFVTGFQEVPGDNYHLQASACCKHYVANEMERTSEAGVTWDRHTFDAKISQQDLMDSYMLPFQTCVERGRVSSLMCSYNSLNGEPACTSSWLLQDVARNTWGFDGYITSDCDAVADVYRKHNYTKTPEEAVRDALRAGTDLDCGSFVQDYAQKALIKGVITEADIDARLHMLFRMRFRLNHFDPAGPLDKIPVSTICSDYAKDLARDGVAQAAVLLKNENNLLPLNAKQIGSVAVIGPASNLSKAVTHYYGPNAPCEGAFVNMSDAIQEYVSHVTTALGVPDVLSADTSDVAAAARLARDADFVILALGTNLSVAREGQDVSTGLDFSAGQQALVEAVAAAAKKPVVVVTLTAVPLDLSALVANPKVGAILHVGQPNVQLLGVADVLFGKKAVAGRLVQTIYPASYANQVSIFDFNMRPGPSAWPRPDCPQSQWGKCPLGTNPGRTHRFYTGKAVFPFGFGLSYSTFAYEVVEAPKVVELGPLKRLLRHAKNGFLSSSRVAAAGPAAVFKVRVTNKGKVDSDDVVLGFLVPPGAGKDGMPLQSLFDFQRVHVKAGHSAVVELRAAFPDFAEVDATGARHPLPGTYQVRFGLQESASFGTGFAEQAIRAQLKSAEDELMFA